MKKMKRKLVAVVMVISLFMTMPVFAAELTWADVPGHHNQSQLLSEEVTSSSDSIYGYARGDILSTSTTEITNRQDGTLHLRITTYAHTYVDRIHHALYLDQWDENNSRWVQIESWDFEETKEDAEDGELTFLSNGFTVSGLSINKYYRVRGLHAVELNDEIEANATETDGVLLTNSPY